MAIHALRLSEAIWGILDFSTTVNAMVPIKPAVPLEQPAGCGHCRTAGDLAFPLRFAYQPIVDIESRSIFGHEALVRGPNGEGALTVLSQVTDLNRY